MGFTISLNYNYQSGIDVKIYYLKPRDLQLLTTIVLIPYRLEFENHTNLEWYVKFCPTSSAHHCSPNSFCRSKISEFSRKVNQ